MEQQPSSHTCPPPPPPLLLSIHQYHYSAHHRPHYFSLNGHLDQQEDITAASVLRPPPSATPSSPPSPTLARPARLHSSSSRCATETSASLLRQIPAVLPFFTLDGPRHLLSRYAAARHSSPPLPAYPLPPSPHTFALLSCRTHVSNRTPEPSSRSAIGVRFPINRHPPHPFAIDYHHAFTRSSAPRNTITDCWPAQIIYIPSSPPSPTFNIRYHLRSP